MRNLYVVTHPEATHHVDGIVGGWYDAPLTDRGVRQAELVAISLRARLATRGPVPVFASDLLRTRQTAEPIATLLGVEVALDPDLRERSYGVAEGRPAGSTPYLPPPSDGDRMRHHDGVEGSETRLVWATRVYAALDRILGAAPADLVVVTHGGTATYLIAAWIGLPVEAAGRVKFAASPGAIAQLREDDMWHDRQVVTLNELSHLT